jgi:DNA-binding LacI/PurR family transcriptional regulator
VQFQAHHSLDDSLRQVGVHFERYGDVGGESFRSQERSRLKQHADLLAYDHIEAMRILQGAHTLEIPIPSQVSMVCFNDEYLCSIVTPPLTTVAVPSRQMGQIAANMLLKHLQSPVDFHPECVKLQQSLIVRASTAAAVR